MNIMNVRSNNIYLPTYSPSETKNNLTNMAQRMSISPFESYCVIFDDYDDGAT